MKIKSISWIGYPTDNLKESRHFFQEILGLKIFQTNDEEDFAMFELPSKQYFEVLGKNNTWHKYLARPVIAFEVDDVPAAKAELEKKGVNFVSDIARDGGFVWAFFEGPDGYLYEILSKPEEKKENA
jgi:catechol 2,3-dioxygenase-like lactoylglutathione lyase family enzyme